MSGPTGAELNRLRELDAENATVKRMHSCVALNSIAMKGMFSLEPWGCPHSGRWWRCRWGRRAVDRVGRSARAARAVGLRHAERLAGPKCRACGGVHQTRIRAASPELPQVLRPVAAPPASTEVEARTVSAARQTAAPAVGREAENLGATSGADGCARPACTSVCARCRAGHAARPVALPAAERARRNQAEYAGDRGRDFPARVEHCGRARCVGGARRLARHGVAPQHT